MNAAQKWVLDSWRSAIPKPRAKSVVQWAVDNRLKLPGSARSETYDPDISPWNKEPLKCAGDGTRRMTYVKPIQAGGSTVGEIAICYWIATENGGDIQYNWQNDSAADARWMKRVERILQACDAVMARTSKDRFKWQKGLVIFPHLNFIMQGVLTDRNVASDSICRQVNEEIHDSEGGWAPGRLAQAHGRLTAYWNSIAFQISNAGYDGDQLHECLKEGTHQHWTVLCPGCGAFHAMRVKYDPDRPDLGGLRYDADGCRREDGTYDYFKMQSSVRYQMPCGFEVHDIVTERRALSLSGKYSPPTNPGALPTHRSYTLEAVSIDYIPWIDLIKQKHVALAKLKRGDPIPWSVYLRERECVFYKKGEQPVLTNIILNKAIKKDRAGLPRQNPDGSPREVIRLGAGDYQKGEAAENELPHWWHVIIDAEFDDQNRLHVLLVSEGKIVTEANLVDVFKRHDLDPSLVMLDSSFDPNHVYPICLEHGYYAVKGENLGNYAGHSDGSRKIYSPPKPLHAMINRPPLFPYRLTKAGQEPDPYEPMFLRYSQFGMLDLVAWLRTSKHAHLDIPGDVSPEFKEHMDSWALKKKIIPATGQTQEVWHQVRKRDDMLMCLGYCCLLLLDMGLIGGSTETAAPDSESRNP